MRKILEDIGLGLAVVFLALLYFRSPVATFSSATGYNSLKLSPSSATGDTYGLQVNGTTTVDSNGTVVAPVSTAVLTIGGGTAITNYTCATLTWNPASLSANGTSTANTSLDIPLPSVALGDTCFASLTSATSTGAQVNCNVATAATGTIQLMNLTNAALDLATGTAKICYNH